MLKGGLHLKGVKSGLGNGTQCISLTSTPPSFSGGPVGVLHTCSHTHCLLFLKVRQKYKQQDQRNGNKYLN